MLAQMNNHTPNQSWVVDRGGGVIDKKALVGIDGLDDWERLVYCLWVTDYMMRNAGDFLNAEVMYPTFQSDAKQFAKKLGLVLTEETFSLSRHKLQREYLGRFEAMCEEIKSAEKKNTKG